MIKQKDSRTEDLFNKNIPLAYSRVQSKLSNPIIQRNKNDYEQIALLALYRASRTFKESISKFSTYASKCIDNAIFAELRRKENKINCISLDGPRYNRDWEELCPEARPELSYEPFFGDPIEDLVTDLVKTSPINNKKMATELIYLLLKGYNQKEVSVFLGVSRSYITVLLKKLRITYRDLLKKEEAL